LSSAEKFGNTRDLLGGLLGAKNAGVTVIQLAAVDVTCMTGGRKETKRKISYGRKGTPPSQSTPKGRNNEGKEGRGFREIK
jgi:hypothetical protein